MIRAAAKNHTGVAVVTSKADYDPLLDELRADKASSPRDAAGAGRQGLPRHGALRHRHRQLVPRGEEGLPDDYFAHYAKVMDLSYGENPHQRAAYYTESGRRHHLLSRVEQLHGKKLSFNNLYDLHAARSLCAEFTLPCVVMIKHNNPCGCALGDSLAHAYEKALACDPRQRLRLHHRRQPSGGRADGRASGRAVRRGASSPPATTRRRWRSSPAKQNIRILLNTERRELNPGEIRRQARPGRHPRPGQGQRRRRARRHEGGHRQAPQRAGVGRPALRLPGQQARQEQRHRLRRGTWPRSASAPAR